MNLRKIGLIFIFLLNVEQVFASNVIYGDDNRVEVINAPLKVETLAQSVFILTQKYKIIKQEAGNVLYTRHYGHSFKLCNDEPFYEQPSFGHCTGFLINEDTAVTAGHCLSEEGCRSMSIVFDYKVDKNGKVNQVISDDKIFNCKEVIKTEKNNNLDYTVFKLDKKTSRRGLIFSNDSLNLNQEVSILGAPSGLPLKYSDQGIIRTINDNTFKASLDSYGGNSGSPVFNTTTLEVVGILLGGEDDFIKDQKQNCYRSNRCDQDKCSGEDIMLANKIIF